MTVLGISGSLLMTPYSKDRGGAHKQPAAA
jgi:hypothetical protein